MPNARGLRTSPIVYDGVMYVTNTNSIYALDARSGRLIWQYADTRAKGQGVNRGAAILGDRVYFTTTDNYLVALDRQTGGSSSAGNSPTKTRARLPLRRRSS